MSYVELHPENPQARLVNTVVDLLERGGTIALPTDSGYAIATKIGNKSGMDTIRTVRKLDDKHNFSLLCHSFAQLGELVIVDNHEFRTMKALTPGPYTFILRGTKEVPAHHAEQEEAHGGRAHPGPRHHAGDRRGPR